MSLVHVIQHLYYSDLYNRISDQCNCVIPVTVSIGELTSGVFKVIFLVKAEVRSCNKRKNNLIISKKSQEIGHSGLVRTE